MAVALFLLACCAGCQRSSTVEGPCASRSPGDGIREKASSVDANVTNGEAFDCATLDIHAFRRVVLPMGTQVTSQAPPGTAVVHMTKALHFVGHPPKPVTPQVARRNMGVAFRANGDVVQLATFGEWDSHIEGGAAIHLRVALPPGVGYELKDGLSGETSAASGHEEPTRDSGYWYAAGWPAPEWTALPSMADEDAAREAR